MKPKFIEGGQKNGYDPAVLSKIWSDWESFASYAFNKSHAACYSWVAYQTAYLKANYPAEFMAAIMTRRSDQITEITKLMDECKHMGIATLGPDVNESYQEFAVNKHGEIRFGLSAIKGMGGVPAQAIINEREANGPFIDVFDFVQRINMNAVNKRSIESLVLSGSFDSFDIKREQYFAPNSRGELFIDLLVRYGQRYQLDRQEASNSLFGSMEVEIAHPPVPQAESWSNMERLNRERDFIGRYLSAHPLDEYQVVLKSLCNTPCADLEDREKLAQKDLVLVGGIVTKVEERFSKGKKFGIVTIEDFGSKGELAIFGEEWGRWQGMLTEGCCVYIKGKCSRGRFNDRLYFTILDIQFLQTVKEKAIEKFTIFIDSLQVGETLVEDLTTLIDEHPGNTQLFFQLRNPENNKTILLRSRNRTVTVDYALLNFIEENQHLSYQVN